MKYLGFIKSRAPGTAYFPVELIYVKKGYLVPDGKLFVNEKNAGGYENCFVTFGKVSPDSSMRSLAFMVDSPLNKIDLPVVVNIVDNVERYIENLRNPGPKAQEFFKTNTPFYLRKNNSFLGAFCFNPQNNKICAADGRYVMRYEVKNSDVLVPYKGKFYVVEENLPDRTGSPIEFVIEEIKKTQAADENKISKPEIPVHDNSIVKNLEEKLSKAEKTIAKLEKEKCDLEEKLNTLENKPVLYLNGEKEFFPGELKEIVMAVLEKELLDRTDTGTRRSDVLQGIINNNSFSHELENRRQKIRELLNAYNGLSGTMRRQLEELGLFISYEDGKHYKVRYFGDTRYWITMAKTPSDGQRGDKNLVAKILKNML